MLKKEKDSWDARFSYEGRPVRWILDQFRKRKSGKAFYEVKRAECRKNTEHLEGIWNIFRIRSIFISRWSRNHGLKKFLKAKICAKVRIHNYFDICSCGLVKNVKMTWYENMKTKPFSFFTFTKWLDKCDTYLQDSSFEVSFSCHVNE